jgi:exopolysaccharide biosynthesis polyprenyl glycosylphosphotransferase
MITNREKVLSKMMITLQVIITIIVFIITRFFFTYNFFSFWGEMFILVLIALLWAFFFEKFKLGIIFRQRHSVQFINGYIVTELLGGAILIVMSVLMPFIKYEKFVIEYISLFCAINLIVLVAFKYAFYYLMRFLRRKGFNKRNIIIIANKDNARIIDLFLKSKDWGYTIGRIVTPQEGIENLYDNVAVIPDQEELMKRIPVKGYDDIFYCLPINDKSYNPEKLIDAANELGVAVHIIQSDRMCRAGYNKHSVLFETHQTTPTNYFALRIKDTFDLFFSVGVIFVLLPFMAVIAVLIKLHDGGHIFFRQERIGLNGRRFVCYKFRTMIPNAESMMESIMDRNESDGPTFKIENDPRITKVGRFLRKTSLDELPQFYNVIKGEMSVVGPRPPLLKEVVQYEKYQLRRLSMKPGITCIWQVSGRNSISFKEWMRMDLDYIDQWSLWLDIKIMFKTVGVIFKANGQ